jgi:hypothetical protein
MRFHHIIAGLKQMPAPAVSPGAMEGSSDRSGRWSAHLTRVTLTLAAAAGLIHEPQG